jgi:hypothetical protein
MSTKISEYKGHKILALYKNDAEESDKFPPFSFGVSKAKLILENFEDIKKFVEENGFGTKFKTS